MTRQSFPADGVDERGRVGGEVGHGVGPRWHARPAEAALVVGEQLERLPEGALGQPGPLPQVAARARDAQESLAGARQLAVELYTVGDAGGHARQRIASCPGTSGDGSEVVPMSQRSTAAAQERPSAMAQTIRL